MHQQSFKFTAKINDRAIDWERTCTVIEGFFQNDSHPRRWSPDLGLSKDPQKICGIPSLRAVDDSQFPQCQSSLEMSIVNLHLARPNTLPCIYALERDVQALLAISSGHSRSREPPEEKILMLKFQAHRSKCYVGRADFHLNFARIRAHS